MSNPEKGRLKNICEDFIGLIDRDKTTTADDMPFGVSMLPSDSIYRIKENNNRK